MFNKKSYAKNSYMLNGRFKRKGYDWWWHSFTAYNKKTGESKPFYIEFFIINPSISPNKVILGQDEENRKLGLRPSYLMINVGTWGKKHCQLHKFVPFNEVSIKKCPFEIKTEDFLLNENKTYGEVMVDEVLPGMMCDKGKIRWDLKINKEIAWNVGYGTSWLFRTLKAFEMYWHAQGMKCSFDGEISFNDEEYIVIPEKSYGYADKNWGSDFTSPWVWLSSNHLVNSLTGEELKNSAFDVGGGKPKVFGISLPRKLLGGYYIEGKEYEMNFSKFWHPTKTWFKFYEEKEIVVWKVIQEDHHYKIITDVECEKKDMIFINYEAPTGKKLLNHLYNGGNGKGTLKIYKKRRFGKLVLINELDCFNVGCEYGEFDK